MRRTIFYLDDDEGCLKVFREMFDGEYDVRTEATLAEARRSLAEHPADIVISDQMMPEISGKEFLREVAGAHPASYRVLLTGAITVGDVVREVGAGVIHAFVVKPWTEEEMRRVLERARSLVG
ncbi:MAG TPA: response regulator [Pyrinomonadaceae bacterium]|nr:response regulator [Pyrinomonadaceae bacterium]